MSEVIIKTGIKNLDADLRAVFDANSPKRRQEIKSAIANYDLSRSQLFEVVPEAILRVVVGLRNPTVYRTLLERIPEESRPHLEKAREIAEQHFVDILKHPAVLPGSLMFGEDDEDQRFASVALRTIESIRHMPLWAGQPPRMRPTSRVAFFGARRKLLLDSVFDWDDYLFLVTALMEALICEMEAGKSFAEMGQMELPYKRRMEEYIRELENHLVRIKEIGGVYGFNSGVAEPTVSVKAD